MIISNGREHFLDNPKLESHPSTVKRKSTPPKHLC